jgi:hypothetical protein
MILTRKDLTRLGSQTIVRTIYPQKSVIQQQLHTVPPYIVGAVITVIVSLVDTLCTRGEITSYMRVVFGNVFI